MPNSQVLCASLEKPIRPSAFYKMLQTLLAPTEDATEKTQQVALFDSEMANNHPLKILVVEDNEVNQKVAVRILERLGYKAYVVSSGLAAVEAVRQEQYDTILMDVQMPEMDGLEASRYIRNQVSLWQPRIIAVSAYAMSEDREECLANGMDDFISKPIRVDELISALKKCVPYTKLV